MTAAGLLHNIVLALPKENEYVNCKKNLRTFAYRSLLRLWQ